jgi:hypothetical protein
MMNDIRENYLDVIEYYYCYHALERENDIIVIEYSCCYHALERMFS